MFRIERTNDYGDYIETPYLLNNEKDALEVIKALKEMYFGEFRVKEHHKVRTPYQWHFIKEGKMLTVFATSDHNRWPLNLECLTAIDIGYELQEA